MEKQTFNYDFNDFSMLDLKTLLYKVLSYWKWFLVSIVISMLISKYINDSSQRIYSLESMIAVKEEQNPLFTSSTNIAFNWGGPSDKVETMKTILQSRTHNEKVVEVSNFYVEYLKKGRFRLEDVYGKVPFKINVHDEHFQLLNTLIKFKFIDNKTVNISIELDEDNQDVTLQEYKTFKTKTFAFPSSQYSKNFSIGYINTDFLNFDIELNGTPSKNQEYFIRFDDFNKVVSRCREINIAAFKTGTSLLKLSLDGPNKNRLVDYLNTTINVLEKDQIESKIRYAVKTKDYIDGLFNEMAVNLNNIQSDLGTFKQKEGIYDLSIEGSAIYDEMKELDSKSLHYQERLNYYKRLETYLKNNESLNENNIPVPAVLDVEDPNIVASIGALVAKSKAKEIILQTVTSSHPDVKKLNQEIVLEKSSLLENIKNLKNETLTQLNSYNNRLNSNLSKLKKLPIKEQGLLSLERKYAITEQNFNFLKQKSYEAGTAIASNVSDIKVIDMAKDIGQSPFKPKTGFNTLIGLLLSLIIPLIIILIKEYFNTKIFTVEEIENTSKIPILGVIGNNDKKTNLVVFNYPKDVISEAYRALRSNVQFLLKRDVKSHIILTTSSISGEGKTVTSINLASVFALSGKKTIVVGTDLRKPKLADDFKLDINIGMVNYLIGEKTAEEVIQKTEYDNLYILLSGSVPPNPSELLLSDETSKLMEYLRQNFDYIILDAPPVGIVSDAQELFKFADVILYIIRQGYTEKGMLKLVENKHDKGGMQNVSYVLNDFTLSKRHGYGYGYGYGYGSYGYGNIQNTKKSIFKRIINWFKIK